MLRAGDVAIADLRAESNGMLAAPAPGTKNLQILVATDMIAGNAGPPQGLQVFQG
jgi:hypothetical protein